MVAARRQPSSTVSFLARAPLPIRGQRGTCLTAHPVTILGGMLIYAFLSQPRTAPGPTDILKARERSAILRVQAARQQVEEAADQQEWAWANQELQDAQRALKDVEKDVKEAYADLDNYPLPPYLEESYGNRKALIAVAGGSGVGKSSWINAIRRLKATSSGAARTGVSQSAEEPQMYSFFPGPTGVFQRAFAGVGKLLRRQRWGGEPAQPGDRLPLKNLADLDGLAVEVVSTVGPELDVKLGNGRVKRVSKNQVNSVLAECLLWDLPGVGAPNFPEATYLRQMGIRHFDMVILMTASRFTEAELMLVEELKAWDVPFFLVRSKIDSDMQYLLEDQGMECEIGQDDYCKSECGLENVYCGSVRAKYREDFDISRS